VGNTAVGEAREGVRVLTNCVRVGRMTVGVGGARQGEGEGERVLFRRGVSVVDWLREGEGDTEGEEEALGTDDELLLPREEEVRVGYREG